MMDSSDFLELLRALTHLSSTQLERAQQHIHQPEKHPFAGGIAFFYYMHQQPARKNYAGSLRLMS